ncbi:LAFA_0C01156g1_1 [Lachancea sp. 'fantastica']|nr:LAFA_0C01156g1_1 [Lachancea sp. 'fantastica']
MLRTLHYRYRRLSRLGTKSSAILNHSRAFSSSKCVQETHKSSKVKKVSRIVRNDSSSALEEDNASKTVEKQLMLLPKVGSTDHIKQDELHTDGLFAGNKPLFLGNASIDSGASRNNLKTIFSTLTKVKKVTDGSTSEIDVQGIINDLKSDENFTETAVNHDGLKKPIIPWDASISGMVYNDDPFKAVPRTVVDRLRPYKLIRVERKSKTAKLKAPKLIKLKFHNAKINDETSLVDISLTRNKSTGKTQASAPTSKSKEEFAQSHSSLSQFKFIRSDQHVFKTDVNKLSTFLAKEFQKATKLTIDTEFTNNDLPLYIYIEKTISSRMLLRRFLLKRIVDHTDPLLRTIMTSYGKSEYGTKFEKRVGLKTNTLIQNLCDYLPSIFFSGNSIDCVSSLSPVAAFRRLHWLNYAKRHRVFWGRNIDNDFVYNINENYKMSRNGVRYMKHPISLHCRTFHEAFTEWEEFINEYK